MTPIRLTHTTALVLRALALGARHGFRVMELTGLPSGTVYPVLRRLESWEHVESAWEDRERAREAGRPSRRIYALTSSGLELAARADERLAGADRILGMDAAAGGLRGSGEA